MANIIVRIVMAMIIASAVIWLGGPQWAAVLGGVIVSYLALPENGGQK